MTERWQNGALVALRFFARKCRNHMISGENQQKMTGKSAERAEISAEMRVFLNSAQKFGAERNFSQNAERRRTKNPEICAGFEILCNLVFITRFALVMENGESWFTKPYQSVLTCYHFIVLKC